jgi:hypothetical protein
MDLISYYISFEYENFSESQFILGKICLTKSFYRKKRLFRTIYCIPQTTLIDSDMMANLTW